MYRHHPQWQTARSLVRDGHIGALRTIQSFFSYFNDDPHNIRNDPAYGWWWPDGHRLLSDLALPFHL